MIVVTGATGNVGRPLVQALSAAGHEVVAVARRPTCAVLPGVRDLAVDLSRPDSLKPVLAAADAVFLLFAGELLGGGPAAAATVSAAAGAGRVVLLSSQGARTRPDSPSHAPLRALEQGLQRSGAEWTILRPGGFASNAYAWLPTIRAERTVHAPFGDVGLPVVDPADIAEVAAAALLGGHAGGIYELTGPQTITPRQQAAVLDARFVEQTPEQARAAMLTFMPAPIVEGTLGILGAPSADEQRVSPDVEAVLGRAPRSFADWAARHREAFR
jgi:uncharacterized protein YbjT (DUF2867 family)